MALPIGLLSLALGACSGGPAPDSKLGVASSPRVATGRSIPKGGGIYKVGTPYRVGGRWYVPSEDELYDRTGVASWYGSAFHGRRTANGEIYDMHALTAGHPTLPMPSYAYVTNLDNGRTILVRINDRGPYVNDRMIDLSRRSATELGFNRHGLARVRVRYAGRAPLDGNDLAERRHLAAQPWHRGGVEVAQLAGDSIETGALESPAQAPAWSVAGYRRQLKEAARAAPGGRRATLGGPRGDLIDVGPFATRAEAERMRHELEALAPATVEEEGSGAELAYRVWVGPISGQAAAAVAERKAAAASGALVTQ